MYDQQPGGGGGVWKGGGGGSGDLGGLSSNKIRPSYETQQHARIKSGDNDFLLLKTFFENDPQESKEKLGSSLAHFLSQKPTTDYLEIKMQVGEEYLRPTKSDTSQILNIYQCTVWWWLCNIWADSNDSLRIIPCKMHSYPKIRGASARNSWAEKSEAIKSAQLCELLLRPLNMGWHSGPWLALNQVKKDWSLDHVRWWLRLSWMWGSWKEKLKHLPHISLVLGLTFSLRLLSSLKRVSSVNFVSIHAHVPLKKWVAHGYIKSPWPPKLALLDIYRCALSI